MKNSISINLKKRLLAQAEEAEFKGLTKVASTVSSKIENIPVRSDVDNQYHKYSHSELSSDVESILFNAAVRVQDYFDKTADQKEIANIISSFADEFISSIKTKIGGNISGPFEPSVPGEEDTLEVEIG